MIAGALTSHRGRVRQPPKPIRLSMQGTHRPPSSDSADRRTELAADRTVLAAERTYAAWVRTGVAALAAGVGAKKVLGGVLPDWAVMITGSVLVLFGAWCFIAGVWRELWPGAPPPQPDVRRIPTKALIVLNGFLVLVCLATLLGVWFGRTGGE
jgi:putative membrane protein